MEKHQTSKITPFKTTKVFDANWNAKSEYVINEGGTSSSKTYSIVQVLILKAITQPNKVITVVGQDLPNLKKGAIRDAATIIASSDFVQSHLYKWNRSENTFKFTSGSIVEFASFDNEQDARSGKRDIAFFNEANGIRYDVFEQIAVRTKEQVYIDYNPSALFWVHSKLLPNQDCTLIRSTYKHNPFISDRVKRQILSYEHTDPNKWRVYGLGLPGAHEGQVYTNYRVVDAMPDGCKWRLIGLDFGFTNDPSAAVEVVLSGGELWVDEILYRKGMLNEDIAKELKGKSTVIADSAEPKSIETIRRLGVDIKGAVKGRDSVIAGIEAVKKYPLNITKRSKNIIRELENYLWAKDRHGDYINKPSDNWNHALDALRYPVSYKDLMRTNKITGIAW